MNFPEELLHFVWQFRMYGAQPLQTTAGELIQVIQLGTINKNAGPDFSNAKLKIGETTWVGNVEIHLKSSDWLLHQHQLDHAYDNVILHVVYEDDAKIYRKDGTILPVLVLKGLFPTYLITNYEQLITAANQFPCEKQIHKIDDFLIKGFLSRVLVERLEDKSTEVYEKLKELKNDWDEAFYHLMARNFGFKVNAVPMEMLARSLPQQLFAKHKDNPLQIEALIFGQAGFLNQKFEEAYPQQLQAEYQFLQKKYKLIPIDISLWKFMRMRPQNFPTLRLAQFAALIVNSNHLFSKVLAFKDYRNSQELFENLPVNAYWQNHYHFNKTTENVSLQLGKDSINNILINTLSLFLFAFGKAMDQHNYITRCFYILENLPAENNAVIKQYVNAGVNVKDAYQTQALLQLKKTYCNEKKCLNCGIGIKILKQ
ncbi:DUF2851 family protein [Pedobacter sp. Hv1]|uniref:DUF2851 family protein n=1 Tax=Pedobacter sp. Hv1 TaxID=1740090 RepID=UPI0006D8AC9E|nr:DUF2851 family protein [Pedobacter sp. Hv1]KQC01824.1 hypothetical protein AQF98_05530 [Pedobacter sp. Hv1]